MGCEAIVSAGTSWESCAPPSCSRTFTVEMSTKDCSRIALLPCPSRPGATLYRPRVEAGSPRVEEGLGRHLRRLDVSHSGQMRSGTGLGEGPLRASPTRRYLPKGVTPVPSNNLVSNVANPATHAALSRNAVSSSTPNTSLIVHYPGEVLLGASGQYNGRYVTDSSYSAQWYVYYLYVNGVRQDEAIHFTVLANGGNTPLRLFHISKPFTRNGSTANLHVFYEWNDYTFAVAYTGNNLNELVPGLRQEAQEYLTANAAALLTAAQEFAEEVYRVNTRGARLRRLARSIRRPASLPAGVPSHVPATSTAARPSNAPLSLAETPILSQVYALGQGFDIYGKLDQSGLIRPLFDYSKAGTQVFTFLGKDYLIPSCMTAVQNTAAYWSGNTAESREEFQNSISVHAGVDASYGAFSGEMKADYTSEYEESSLYAYAYNNFYAPLALIELNPGTEYLSSEFLSRVQSLPSVASKDTLPAFESFFTDYGIYYTQKVVLGGSLQFYVAVAQSSQLSSANISAMLKAQYSGLFVSGSLDASVEFSEQWKSYSQSSQTVIRATGGDPTSIAALVGINPMSPSSETVSRYTDWVQSVSTNPALVDFSLKGIWELCGDKRGAVQMAWELFSQVMHPRLLVQTSSRMMSSDGTYTPQPPTLFLGDQLAPKSPPPSPCGYQLLVLDGANLTEKSGVLHDRYYCVSQGYFNYEDMYQQMMDDLEDKGLNKAGNVLVLSSFGLDNNMPPPPSFVGLLQSAGAGRQLSSWENNCDPGSTVGNPSAWISYPANYILVGIFGIGPDSGIEIHQGGIFDEDSATARLEVLFYRESITGQYTLSVGT
ncbi:hypothetical protein F0U60_08650 [Archangium minus]|uniref:MACPF domain-containing protein n=1 Tax=Archangium minus TaxID=83450 RepID=A0ABY9WT30_9BACT|nr:hypothetical protein F0U60_08650 [Archangium minus]